MTTKMNRKFILKRRPDGSPVESDFELVKEPIPKLSSGEFLVRNHFISLDPAQRGWMDDQPSYMPPIEIGASIRATTVGRVEESKNPNFEEGQWVLGLNGIEEYSLVQEGGFTSLIDTSIVASPTNYLSILGAVGSAVGQIAKLKDCRAVGIAGGPEKCKRLLEYYGFDAAIDYRGKSPEQLEKAIKNAAPDGVDVIFENVGGDILDAGILALNEHARVVLCGLISEYNSDPKGARNIWQIIVKQASMKGFLIRDYVPKFAEGAAVMAGWIADDKIKFNEHVEHGIENTFDAFMLLFSGGNKGKLILDISGK